MMLGIPRISGALGALLAALATAAPAAAIPAFAHRYGLTCQACHTVVPHLTRYGEAFLAAGYRAPGLAAKPAFPVSLRIETAYTSAPNAADDGAPLPKATVDEVEMLLQGRIGSRGTFWSEVYALDGGEPGRARDVWLAYRATPDGARVPLTLRAGQMTLPLPLDPETFRETTDHYAVWDQTVGDNPFAFFQPKIGLELAGGDPARQFDVHVMALQGHDAGSGLPARGIDTMLSLRREWGPWRLSAYRYDGTRPLAGGDDRFSRTGWGAGWSGRRTDVDAVYQRGSDATPDGALRSNGGFVQVREAFGTRAFALFRWDATQDDGFARSAIAGVGFRPSRNTRLTFYDTLHRDDTGRRVHTLSSSFLVAL